jgi:very-short-patch-repair endonuclease
LCGKEVYKPKNQLDRASNSFCSQLCANRYQKETDQKDRMRKNGTKSILKQLKNKKPTKLEIAGNKILSEIGISFKEQVPMFEKFIVDVLIEEKKIVIQWDGEYWHLKKTNKDRDNSQDKYLQKCGYFVLRYTDKQIKKDREWVKKDIITKLNQ